VCLALCIPVFWKTPNAAAKWAFTIGLLLCTLVVGSLMMGSGYGETLSLKGDAGRYGLWSQALHRMAQNPSIALWGEHGSSTSVHNGYLTVLMETGIIGLIPFLVLLGVISNRLAEFIRMATLSAGDAFRAAAAISVMSIYAHSMVDMDFELMSLKAAFAFLVAIAVTPSAPEPPPLQLRTPPGGAR
jgi:hypothetical protein